MSLVGTRPPTLDEFMQYEEHHKRRLSLKPGITGMWQVSGRSEIQNFEDVVKLDLEYIDNWPRKLILTNFDRIKFDDRAYIKYKISTIVWFCLTTVLISITI